MNLADLLRKENIFMAQTFANTDDFYTEFTNFLDERGYIQDKENIKRLFVKRENVQSTAIGKGAAAPHIFSSEFSDFLFSIAFIKDGVDFKAPDQQNVFLVFLIMSAEREVGRHLKTLAHIARLVKTSQLVEKVKLAENVDEVYAAIVESEKQI